MEMINAFIKVNRLSPVYDFFITSFMNVSKYGNVSI